MLISYSYKSWSTCSLGKLFRQSIWMASLSLTFLPHCFRMFRRCASRPFLLQYNSLVVYTTKLMIFFTLVPPTYGGMKGLKGAPFLVPTTFLG